MKKKRKFRFEDLKVRLGAIWFVLTSKNVIVISVKVAQESSTDTHIRAEVNIGVAVCTHYNNQFNKMLVESAAKKFDNDPRGSLEDFINSLK